MMKTQRPRSAPTTRPPGILVRFREVNAWNGVSRRLLKKMATRLNLTETDTIHMALADMARTMKLMPTGKVIVNPGLEDLKGMDFSGLRKVLEFALAADSITTPTEEPVKASRRSVRRRA